MTTDRIPGLGRARLAQLLLEVVPGAVLRVGTTGGTTLAVARPGDPRAEVLPCQHRAALVRAQATGLGEAYLEALGLDATDEVTVDLELPAGADLGTGLAAIETDADRRICAVTTLCPRHATDAIRAARTVPLPAHHAVARDPSLAELRLDVARDGDLGVTLLSWVHRPHPSVVGPVEDIARAAAAALAVEELLLSIR